MSQQERFNTVRTAFHSFGLAVRTGMVAALLGTLTWAAHAAVDVNQASQADLETVKGIGPALSAKIMAERQKASFKDWADLVSRVGGVGAGNAARFSQNGLTVSGAAFAPADAAKAAATTDSQPRRKPASTSAEAAKPAKP